MQQVSVFAERDLVLLKLGFFDKTCVELVGGQGQSGVGKPEEAVMHCEKVTIELAAQEDEKAFSDALVLLRNIRGLFVGRAVLWHCYLSVKRYCRFR